VRSFSLTRKLLITCTALLALAAASAGCSASADVTIGEGKTLDAGELETELADQLAPQAGVKPSDVSVACPDDQAVEKGAKFNCTLRTPNGDEVQVNVTLTDDSGGFDAVVPKQ
jgi:hypothetical protein